MEWAKCKHLLFKISYNISNIWSCTPAGWLALHPFYIVSMDHLSVDTHATGTHKFITEVGQLIKYVSLVGPQLKLVPPSKFCLGNSENPWKQLTQATSDIVTLKNENQQLR